MPKTFDATMKYLLDNYAAEWIDWLAPMFGLPSTSEVKAVDADLSIVQATADKVFEIVNPEPAYLHLEAQSSSDPQMPERMLLYNTLIRIKFKRPVYSVLLLLRPEANAKSITGELTEHYYNNDLYLLFRYKCIKVWELPGLELLHGNLGTVPLAFLTDDAKGHFVEWVQIFNERAAKESIADQTRNAVLFLGSLLAGLRYNEEEILKAFHGVNIMKESSIYQHFFREAREEGRMAGVLEGETKGRLEGETKGRLEGETKGRLEGETKGRLEGETKGRLEGELNGIRKGKSDTLISILRSRFGEVPPAVQAKILAVTDFATLDAAILRAFTIPSLDELAL